MCSKCVVSFSIRDLPKGVVSNTHMLVVTNSYLMGLTAYSIGGKSAWCWKPSIPLELVRSEENLLPSLNCWWI